ncbi:hypothetical protein A2U01_0089833, partial [Trifolium medium]|nr:hypothetical protein [Trifolium medium]
MMLLNMDLVPVHVLLVLTSVGAGAGASLGAGARVGACAGVRVGVTKSFDSFVYRRCFRSLPYTTQKIKENIT